MTDRFAVARTLAATPDQAFDLWVTPEHFAVWFGTEAVEIPADSMRMDVREGGHFEFVMNIPGGPQIDWEGDYKEITRPTHLAFTLTDVPGTFAGEPIIVDFTPVDAEHTDVTISQPVHHFEQAQVDATIAGYNQFFDAQEALLARLS